MGQPLGCAPENIWLRDRSIKSDRQLDLLKQKVAIECILDFAPSAMALRPQSGQPRRLLPIPLSSSLSLLEGKLPAKTSELIAQYLSAADHIMQAALALHEGDHDEADIHNPAGKDFGEKARS